RHPCEALLPQPAPPRQHQVRWRGAARGAPKGRLFFLSARHPSDPRLVREGWLMAWISPNRHGYLRVCFRFQGIECKEGTKLRDIPANRKLLRQKVHQIQYAIDQGYSTTATTSPTAPKRTCLIRGVRGRCSQPACPLRTTPCSGLTPMRMP